MSDGQSIVIEYKNERPLELLDFTASLAAVGDEFKHFAADTGGAPEEARLYIREIRPGSVIAELFFWAQQMPMMQEISEHRDIAAAFMGNWQEALHGILKLTPESKDIPKGTLKNARNFVEPIAKDGGTINAVFTISSADAAAIAYNAGHLLAGQMPDEARFENEPLILWQMRDGPPARAGDMGRIDRFSEKPKKLTFGTEDAKRSILDREEHPFSLIYFVSGIVKTAGGKIAAYHILSVEGTAAREED